MEEILLAKLNHYVVCGVSNDWFRFYLSDCQWCVFINGYDSSLTKINCGVPQGSVLGPLLFLLYINDLNQVIKFCKVHHFADDTKKLGKFDYQKTWQICKCWPKKSC